MSTAQSKQVRISRALLVQAQRVQARYALTSEKELAEYAIRRLIEQATQPQEDDW